MKIKDYKCICGNEDFYLANKSKHIGIFCSYCGKWFKWANKDEQNLALYGNASYKEEREISGFEIVCRSDFDVVSKDTEVDERYGLNKFYITREEIAAILSDKMLYSTVNCGEYAITVEMAESEDRND